MNNWTATTIGAQVTLQRGFDITRKEQRDGPIPVVSSGGISSYHDVPKAKGPGVILGRKGVVGSVYYQTADYWPHDTTLWVKDFHGNSERFVYYFFRAFSHRLAGLDVGSANPTLNRNHVHPIRVLWPPKPDQERIAEILGALDDKIDLNKRTNVTLESLAQAVFRDWFVDFGPVRRKFDGVTEPTEILGGLVTDTERAQQVSGLFPSEIGTDELPIGWETRPIGELAEIVGGSTPSTTESEYWDHGTHCWATPKDLARIGGLFLLESARKVTDAGLQKIGSGLSPAGTVLLSSRAPIGYLAIAGGPTAVNQGFIALRPTLEMPTAVSLFWCKQNMDLIKAHANGSTFQEISKKNFRPLPVVTAGSELTEAFVEIVDPLLALISERTRENRTLNELRDLLLSKLMSGDIRLGEAEERLQEVA